MRFPVVKQAYVNTLLANAGNNFRVIGYQKRATSEKEVEGLNRSIQVFYSSGGFTGGHNSAQQHLAQFRLIFMCSSKAEMDLAVIEDPDSTPEQRLAAVEAGLESEARADASIDEVMGLAYDITLACFNKNFGIPRKPVGEVDGFIISQQKIRDVRKDQPLRDGSLCTITGYFDFECQFVEARQGITPVVPDFVSDAVFNYGEDSVQMGVGSIQPYEED